MDTLKSKISFKKNLTGDIKETVVTVTETKLTVENALGGAKQTTSVSEKIFKVVNREFDKIQENIHS